MWQVILFLFVIGLIANLLNWVGVALYYLFVYFVAPLIVITIIFLIARSIYFFFNPVAKEKHLARKRKEEAKLREDKAHKEAIAKAVRERSIAEAGERRKIEIAEARAAQEMKIAEERRRIEEEQKKELARQQHRDADKQNDPYTYQIGRHGNESLAIRYGIANQERKIKEYWYYAAGGEKMRNKDRELVYYEPAGTIQLKKTGRLSKDLYSVLLTDFRDRPAKAVIEVGTEYVKTFYPLNDEWFEKHEDLERTLKGNNTFTLKELATFHVQKAT